MRSFIPIVVILVLCKAMVTFKVVRPYYFREVSVSTSKQLHNISIPDDTDDGCQLGSAVAPDWSEYTAEDRAFHLRTRTCFTRLQAGDGWLGTENLTKLSCQQDGEYPFRFNSLNKTENNSPSWHDLVRRYRRLWFSGDSVMQQKYFTFLCMLDPLYANKDHVLILTEPNSMMTAIATYPPSNFKLYNQSWMYSSLKWSLPIREAPYFHEFGNKTTIVFTKWGNNFGKSQELFQRPPSNRVFPASDENEPEAVILNAGHHYDINGVGSLRRQASRITQLARNSSADVYFYETGPEEWRSSNGMFVPRFMFRTNCAPLSPLQLEGTAHTNASNLIIANSTGVVKTFHLGAPKYEHFGRIYPHMFDHANRTLLPRYVGGRWEECIPYCLPPDWRSKIALPLLMEKEALLREESQGQQLGNSNIGASVTRPSPKADIAIVPVWHQLVKRGILNAKLPKGDCTHKSIDALIEMNKQLVRVIEKRQRRQRDGDARWTA